MDEELKPVTAKDFEFEPYEIVDEVRICPRCTVLHLLDDFRGEVCGWCAEDLERVSNEA